MRPSPTSRGILHALLPLAVVLCASSTAAQTLTLRMLNGKSGKPVNGKSVTVEYKGSPEKTSIPIDKHGIGHLTLPPGATAISLIAAVKVTKQQSLPAYTVCGPFGEYLPIPSILAHGFVPHNACNPDLHLTAAPGEILYLIQPLPWYTPAIE